MQRSGILVAVAALTLASAPLRAEEVSYPSQSAGSAPASSSGSSSSGSSSSVPRGWLLNGATVGSGQTYFLGEIGWPGINLSLLHGMSDKFDLGGTFAFVYGLEGMPELHHYRSGIAPGLKLNAILKLNLASKDKFNLGLRLNPGFALYFPSRNTYAAFAPGHDYFDSSTMFGLQFPLEILAGIVALPSLSINIGISMPMVLFFVPDFSFVFPVQPGFGVEYKLDSSIVLTLDTRFGPSILIVPDDTRTEFAFRVQFGLGYRF